jgi:tRNA(adenine34) deaminase
MAVALEEAALAASRGEVPVGAVLVVEGRMAARTHNRTVADHDPAAHAEVLALRGAGAALGDFRVGGTLYVTLEPCLMCMGAMIQARVQRLVFGARDPKAGAAVSLYRIAEDGRLNHRFEVAEGLRAAEAAAMLSRFFAERRLRKRECPG